MEGWLHGEVDNIGYVLPDEVEKGEKVGTGRKIILEQQIETFVY